MAHAAPRAVAKREENARLSAVLCPLMPREIPTAVANLDFWEHRFPPAVSGDPVRQEKARLVFAFSGKPDRGYEATLRDAFNAHPKVRRAFAACDVLFLDLPPEKDLYVRKAVHPPPPYGFKSGPNWMFYESLKALRYLGGFVFLMETDCQPLVPNWLVRVNAAAGRSGEAWIVGAHYSGIAPLHWALCRHINGNALYNVGDAAFWTFMDGFFWDWMHNYIRNHDPSLAYDCAWETFLASPEMSDPGHPHWLIARDVLHRFRLSDFIINVGGAAEQAGHFVWSPAQLRSRFPNALIVHGPLSVGTEHRRGVACLGHMRALHGVEFEKGAFLASADEEDAIWERSAWLHNRVIEGGTDITLRIGVESKSKDETPIRFALRNANGQIIARKVVKATLAQGFMKAKVSCTAPGLTAYIVSEVRIPAGADGCCRVSSLALTITRDGKVILPNLDLLS
ncbi:hypothetical protein ACE7GA_26310 [Roseomonas sp. CCTCC AB2023176]|uniref:hypothetical protein n=1 Tax=Roseomonas sp. CCTCC AB2023176 TaxID=3342640 RepID=UPI0035D5884C